MESHRFMPFRRQMYHFLAKLPLNIRL